MKDNTQLRKKVKKILLKHKKKKKKKSKKNKHTHKKKTKFKKYISLNTKIREEIYTHDKIQYKDNIIERKKDYAKYIKHTGFSIVIIASCRKNTTIK